MLIRCTDKCRHQRYGYCTLRDTYTNGIEAPRDRILKSGCVYFADTLKDEMSHAREYPARAEMHSTRGLSASQIYS